MLLWTSETQQARRRVHFHLVDATDGLAAETSEADGQPQLSVNGGAWGDSTNVLVATGNGGYYLDLTVAEIGTLGMIAWRYKSAATAEFHGEGQVVSFDPYDAAHMGLSFMGVLGDVIPVPSSVLGPSPTFAQLLGWMVLFMRNAVTVDDNWVKIHNDSGTEIAKFAISDDDTTFTRGKAQTP